jgi:putative redox protein
MQTVVVESREGLVQQVSIRGKQIIADEPVESGGLNQGPTPYELLLGALGTCTAMTLIMYARRKGWPLEGVRIELTHERVHAKDCEDCEDKDAYLDRFTKVITVGGPLDETQRARLEEISRRCPVHQTLLGTIRIEDELRLAEASA